VTVNLQNRTEDMTTRELAAQLGEQMSQLVKDEIALAKAETFASARQGARGGGMFSGAALTGLTGWLALVAAAIAGIALALPVWAAALIIGAALAACAGVLARLGIRCFKRGTPPLKMTADSIRDDLNDLATSVRRARERG
jgi:Putative Actinobacterial Holin-X, holin superfamily III